ncbi:response regulator [Hungatella hathewayi]|uniref:response regulator transcription factor n=1 Tax=Hungatella hathewayi TaxID=154046 RepID=UPI000336AA0E|nr:response regulator [Hungatella hathewayi]CCZ59023.1 aspartate carbamoyltransferase [Hungatella hathewayi CAG:224]
MDYAYRILAVDDEPDILRTNRRYLEAQGYQVDTAACASEALEHLKNQNYDAILLDVNRQNLVYLLASRCFLEKEKASPRLKIEGQGS